MKFKLDITRYFFKEDEIAQYEAMGFEFIGEYHNHGDNGLETTLTNFRPHVTFSSLKELDNFLAQFRKWVIYTNYDGERILEIYNEYRE